MAAGFPPSWGEPVNMFGGNGYTLRAGMVVSVEPNLFIHEERLGVRLIDNVLITEDRRRAAVPPPARAGRHRVMHAPRDGTVSQTMLRPNGRTTAVVGVLRAGISRLHHA